VENTQGNAIATGHKAGHRQTTEPRNSLHYADLLNDNENVKALEKSISGIFAQQIEPY
jgi:hypothetical protein